MTPHPATPGTALPGTPVRSTTIPCTAIRATDLSPATSLVGAGARHPDRPCLVWFDEGGPRPSRDEDEGCAGAASGGPAGPDPAHVLTAGDAADTLRRLVTVLADLGVGPGTRVALVLENSPWHFLVHAACAWLHAVTVPISPRRPGADLAELLDLCGPALVLTRRRPGEGPLGGRPPGGQPTGGRTHTTLTPEELAARTALAHPRPGPPPSCSEELATLVHTSGSSGTPKAVELTHANLWWASQCFREGFEYSPATDVVGVCAPLSHIGGFNGTALDMFSHGGTVVLTPDPFDPLRVLECVERFRVTTMFLVPTMCRALLHALTDHPADLSSWRLPLVGGDALDAGLAAALRGVGLRPLHVWGMTETAGAGSFLHPDTPGVPASSIGTPFAHVRVRLVDEGGAEVLTPGRTGEMQVSGPGVSHGYFRGHAVDDTTHTGPDAATGTGTGTAQDDTWVPTGDLARTDAAGNLHLIGRRSRMISTGGESVPPLRVEHALLSVAGIRAALVVGVPDEYWGQRVAALVVADTPTAAAAAPGTAPTPGTTPAHGSPTHPTTQEVQAHLREVLAPWELPRTLRWVDHLPLTPTGKPDPGAALTLLTTTGTEPAHVGTLTGPTEGPRHPPH